MKTISAALQAHLGGETTTLATLWKVKRQDTTILGFTDHDQDIVFGGVTYMASTGFSPTATESGSSMSVDNMQVDAFLDSSAITEADIRAGLYNYADVEVRIVNWADLTMNELKLRKGTLGQVTLQNGTFSVEIRGLSFFLSTAIGETYGAGCRNEVGDLKCKVDLTLMVQSGSVSTSADQQHLVPSTGLVMTGSSTPTLPAPAKWFNDGVITFTSGLNNGFSMEVTSWDGTTIQLFEPMFYTIAPGDTFTIQPGCNKGSDCNTKFVGIHLQDGSITGTSGNILNKHSEDFIPGQDAILMFPDIHTGN